ncbi:MAG TPA: thioesterase family protein [Pirellulales bacterium]
MTRSTKSPVTAPPTFQTTRRVEFRDTDAAGIMHFSAFFNYMEQVEHEFLRHMGLSVITHDEEGTISWPRVSASCDYRGAVQFEDILDVEVQIIRQGEKSITYGFTFLHGKRPVAQGQITTVCCRLDAKAPPRSIPIPDWIVAKIAKIPKSKKKKRGG